MYFTERIEITDHLHCAQKGNCHITWLGQIVICIMKMLLYSAFWNGWKRIRGLENSRANQWFWKWLNAEPHVHLLFTWLWRNDLHLVENVRSSKAAEHESLASYLQGGWKSCLRVLDSDFCLLSRWRSCEAQEGGKMVGRNATWNQWGPASTTFVPLLFQFKGLYMWFSGRFIKMKDEADR